MRNRLETLQDVPIPSEDLEYLSPEGLKAHVEDIEGAHAGRIGHSRDGMPLYGVRLGNGHQSVSIIAGCHADEPVGPITAQVLPDVLRQHFPELLEAFRFFIVPQMNPDGAEKNRVWWMSRGSLKAYVEEVVREGPGDDIEFGFGDDRESRSECAAARAFVGSGAPFRAHFSLHGMAFSEGAWFLVCKEWQQHAEPIMASLSALCTRLAFPLHDIDRRGEKGFHRIREGFCTTPTQAAMRAHFLKQNDPKTAAKFAPSSMEYVQSLGGEPLCMVSEVPLFLIGRKSSSLEESSYSDLRDDLAQVQGGGDRSLDSLVEEYALSPMPLELQVRLQVAMIVLALDHVVRA